MIRWSDAIRNRDFGAIIDWFAVYFFGAGVTGLLVVGLAAGFEDDVQKSYPIGLRVFALGLMFAAASAVSGWVLGLLFGVPRTLARGLAITEPKGEDKSKSGQDTALSPTSIPSWKTGVNTNLEDISDWLTKTIVGVGLTQLFNLPGFLWRTAEKINVGGFHWEPYGQLLALCLFMYFASGGFWLGYVGTRTMLTLLFEGVNKELQGAAIISSSAPLQLSITERTIAPAADPDTAKADRILQQTPIQKISTPRELAAWGAAQARAGDLDAAKVALEEALKEDVYNAMLKAQLATVYSALGKIDEAASLVRDAAPSEISVFTALYDPPPEGFERAIKIGEAILADRGRNASSNLHVWLASAYGQKYSYLKERGAGGDILNDVKIKVLRQIEAAIRKNPQSRNLMRQLWKPEPGSPEDDLAGFSPNDPDLVRLLEES
jgi:hypothetical protein